MISKEQYLQAKKTIADYELQEYQSRPGSPAGHIGPDVIRKVKEEAAARGYVKGAKVNGETLTGTLVDVLTYYNRYILNGMTESGKKVFIYDMLDNRWAELDPKSPLQEAMDRGYRKGAVVKAGTEWTLTSDPYMEDGEVRCQSWLDGVESPVTIRIVNKEGEYTVKLIKAPESPVNNK